MFSAATADDDNCASEASGPVMSFAKKIGGGGRQKAVAIGCYHEVS